MQSGNVLGVGAVSVLPATTAYILFPSLHATQLGLEVMSFAGLWAISYIGVTTVVRFIKK
jgi:hypothetical protein